MLNQGVSIYDFEVLNLRKLVEKSLHELSVNQYIIIEVHLHSRLNMFIQTLSNNVCPIKAFPLLIILFNSLNISDVV